MKLLAVLSFLTVLSCGLCRPHNTNSTAPLLDEYLSAFSDALDGITRDNTQASRTPEEVKEDFRAAIKIDFLLRKSAKILMQSPLIRVYLQWVQKHHSNMVLLPTLVKDQLQYSTAGDMFNEVVTEMRNRPTAAKLWQEIYGTKTNDDFQIKSDDNSFSHRAPSRVRRSLGIFGSSSGVFSTVGKHTSSLLQYKVKAIEAVSGFLVKFLQRGVVALS